MTSDKSLDIYHKGHTVEFERKIPDYSIPSKQYLGDAISIEWDPNQEAYLLTAEIGDGERIDTISFRQDVMDCLFAWLGFKPKDF